MRFDNKDFEIHAAESIKTLDDLDKALEFKNSSKGFSDIQNGMSKLDFSGLHDNISSIDNAFTTLAGSIERNFLDRISQGLISFGENLWNNTIGQITSGGKTRALNIEQAKFKIKGLGKEWDDVSGDIDYAVSGTAYGLDAAASAASQFLASGVEEGEDMKAALRGISGVAAMTSSDYQEIARVFTAAAGKGHVQAIELNRLSLRGINAAATLAKYMGVTESEVREMSKKGKIDFNTFAHAMDSAFGEHAKKANETFTGSLSNIKAALSRIGEIFYEPWLKNMIPVNNAIRISLNKIITVLKQDIYPIEGELKSFKTVLADLIKFWSGIVQEFIKSFDPFISRLPYRMEHVLHGMDVIREGLENFHNTFKTLNNMLQNPWDFDVTLSKRLLKANDKIKNEEWKLAREMVAAKQYDANYNIKADEKQMKFIKEKGLSLEHVQSIVDALTGKEQKYLDGITQKEINYAKKIHDSADYDSSEGILYNDELRAEMTELGLDAERVQKYLDKLTTGENSSIKRSYVENERGAKLLLYIYDEFYKMEHLVGITLQKLQRIGVAVVRAFKQVRDTFHPADFELPSIVDFLISIVKKFEIAGERFAAIKSIARGVFSIVELIWYAIQKMFTAISDGVSGMGKSEPTILKFLAKFGDYFWELAQYIINGEGTIPSIIETIKDAFSGLWETIQDLVGEDGKVRTFFKGIVDWVSGAFTTIVEAVKTILGFSNDAEGGESSGLGAIIDMIMALFTPDETTLAAVGDFIHTFVDDIGNLLLSLLDFAKFVCDHLGTVFDWVWHIIEGQGDNISNLLDALFKFLTKLLNGEFRSDIFEHFADAFIAVADAIKTIFETIQEVVLAIKDPVVVICKSVSDIVATFAQGLQNIMHWISDDPEASYGAAAFFAIIDLIGKGLTSKNRPKFMKTLRSLPTTIAEFFGSLQTSIRMAVTGTPIDQLKKFSEALLILSLGIFVLMGAFTNMYGMGFDSEGNHSDVVNSDAIASALTTMVGFIVFMIGMLKWLGKYGAMTKDISLTFLTVLIAAMSSAVLKISIAFAVIGLIVKSIGMENAKFTATLIAGLVTIFMVTVYIIMKLIDNLKGASGSGLGSALKGVATIIAMVGLAISLISGAFIKVAAAVSILELSLGRSGAEDMMQQMFLGLIAVMGMMMVYVFMISYYAEDFAKINFKTLLGLAIVLLVIGKVINTITTSIIKLAAFITITGGNTSAVKTSFLLIAGIMALTAGLMAVLFAMSKNGQYNGVLKAALGLAAIMLVMTFMIQQVCYMVALFDALGISDKSMNKVLAIVITLGVITMAMMAITAAVGTPGATAFLLIAVGVAAIAAAVWLMADAVSKLILVFMAFAAIYPAIKPIIPDMLADMKTQLPEFITLVGELFRGLMHEILQSAPLLAAVIVEVLVLIAAIGMQKAPIIVAKWLLMLDEIITLLLVGAGVILPKLLALLLIFLGYIEANAFMLGERLTMILLKTFFGAFMAIGHFFDDYLPKWVEENFDKIDKGIVKYLSEHSKFYDSIGDFIYKVMEGKTREEDWKELANDISYVWIDGHMVPKDETTGNLLSESEFDALKEKWHEDAQKEVEETFKDEKTEVEIPTTIDTKQYLSGIEGEDSIKKDMDDAAKARAKALEEQEKTSVKSEGEAGAEAANKYTDSFNLSIGNSDMSSGIMEKLGGLIGISGDKGTEAGNAFSTNFMSQLGGMDMTSIFSGTSSDALMGNATANLDQFSITDQMPEGFSWDASTNQFGMGAADLNAGADILNTTNSNMTGLDTIQGNDNGETKSMLGQLKTLITNIGDKFSDSVVVPKDAKFNITAMLDKQELGEGLYPVLDTIDVKKAKLASSYAASINR
jgi:tape measure domain-containing protein